MRPLPFLFTRQSCFVLYFLLGMVVWWSAVPFWTRQSVHEVISPSVSQLRIGAIFTLTCATLDGIKWLKHFQTQAHTPSADTDSSYTAPFRVMGTLHPKNTLEVIPRSHPLRDSKLPNLSPDSRLSVLRLTSTRSSALS